MQLFSNERKNIKTFKGKYHQKSQIIKKLFTVVVCV